MEESLNVFGEPLIPCSEDPLTGFFRDACCNTSEADLGSHTVCVALTQSFLEYSRFRGNDLSTPVPEHNFPGLKAGDSWCLCAARWLEAYQHESAPRVYMQKTHQKALEIIPFALLKEFAADLN